MKNIFLSWLVFLSLSSFSQVIADPATNQLTVVTAFGDIANNNSLTNGIIRLRVPIYNLNTLNALPSGSCKIKIGLGSKIVLDPAFQLSMLPAGYFSWTINTSGGQVEISGNLVSTLPKNFIDTLTLPVKGSTLGSSTITTNFLVTNHNTTVTLSDENPSNNNASLPYTIASILPVTFTQIGVNKSGCSLKVNFSTAQEINVNRYEIEMSKNGNHYSKKGEISARNARDYSFEFFLDNNERSKQVLVRIKSVDNDGKFKYSIVKAVNGLCEKSGGIVSYPNPIKLTDKITIASQDGLLDGHYKISLFDINGKLIREQSQNLNRVKQFSYDAGYLSAGKYLIQMINVTTQERKGLQIEKL